MKIAKQFAFIVLTTLLLLSCSDYDMDSNLNYRNLAFVFETDNSEFIIVTDEHDTLEISNSNEIDFVFADSQRILIEYVVLGNSANSTNKYSIEIQQIQQILYKNIVVLTTTNQDSLGSDPIEIIDSWLSDTNLNIEFAFYGGSATHYINLSRPIGLIDTLSQPIQLTFQHNKNDEIMEVAMRGIATFNLSSLKTSFSDTTKFTLHSHDYFGNSHALNGTVIFN